MDRFGTVFYEGKEYRLTSDAELTNRVLPGGYINYHEAEDDQPYDFEMFATAVDESGDEFVVTWIFEGINGENDLGYHDLDYSSPYDVKPKD